MASYEMIREIFNSCDNSKMRDVFITEIETDNVDEVASKYIEPQMHLEKYITNSGVQIFELSANGLIIQKLTFTKLN